MSKLLELAKEYYALDLPEDPELRRSAIIQYLEDNHEPQVTKFSLGVTYEIQ